LDEVAPETGNARVGAADVARQIGRMFEIGGID
jgi:hypothetical protein